MANGRAPRVSVVIPNWNGAIHLPDCLSSLAGQTMMGHEVVVVDNGSTDDSLDLIRRDFSATRIVALGSNRGFPAAVNAGIRSTNTEYIAVLNNDTRADTHWLERLVDALDRYPVVGFCSSKMLRFDEPNVIDSAGHAFSITRGDGIDLGSGDSAQGFDRPLWVFGACAGAAIYRRTLFEDIGLFDEEFFFLYEDVDVDMRAQLAGHRCLYVPGAVVYHKRGGSHDSASPEVQAMAIRNRFWVIGKNLPLPLLPVASIGPMALVARHVLRALAHRVLRRIRPLAHRVRVPQSAPRLDPMSADVTLHLWSQIAYALRRLPDKRRDGRSSRRLGSREIARTMTPREFTDQA